ncbi:MAG TPA: hypothetical protein VGI88_13550, partial [Verrucomicrobiae bacterium]
PNGGPGIWSDTADTDAIYASTKGSGAYAVFAQASDNANIAVVANANNTNATTAAYGVSASTTSTNGSAVIAYAANSASPAITIGNGSLRVANAGIDTATTAFIHVATAGNTSSYITTITNPLTDGDPNAILIVTHQFSPPGIAGAYETHPYSVWYNGSKWTIYHDDITAILGESFNVLVIKH